jgi:hypothetical protein
MTTALARRVRQLARQHRRQEGRCRCNPPREKVVAQIDEGGPPPVLPAVLPHCRACGGITAVVQRVVEEVVEAPGQQAPSRELGGAS